MKDLIKKILKEETKGEYILEIPNLRFIPNADLENSEGRKEAWDELLRLLNGKPFIFDDDLNLSYTEITSLGNLQSVNGFLSLFDCVNLTSLGNLQSVNGNLYLYNCNKLNSLGNLQSVNGGLNLYRCVNLTSLGNLESVDGNLNLYRCVNLTSLGNLQSVNGFLNLYKCEKLNSLGNLQSVGGDLNLINTPFSEKYSEEEIRQMVNIKGKIIF